MNSQKAPHTSDESWDILLSSLGEDTAGYREYIVLRLLRSCETTLKNKGEFNT